MALHAVLLHRLHGTPVAVLNSPRLASQLAQLAAQLAAKATRFACSKCHFEGTLPACCGARVAGDGPNNMPQVMQASRQRIWGCVMHCALPVTCYFKRLTLAVELDAAEPPTVCQLECYQLLGIDNLHAACS
jgi:hypothetical protein